jgi:hypothetical protein
MQTIENDTVLVNTYAMPRFCLKQAYALHNNRLVRCIGKASGKVRNQSQNQNDFDETSDPLEVHSVRTHSHKNVAKLNLWFGAQDLGAQDDGCCGRARSLSLVVR